jgi:hypothetical protein
MSWSASQHKMALKLQQIERARKAAAEARLAGARMDAADARDSRDEAAEALEAAEEGWAAQLKSGRLELELGKSAAAELIGKDCELGRQEDRLGAAEEQLANELEQWRSIEAKVRSGERALRTGRRMLARRGEARADQALAERTTWAWFGR